MPSSSRKLDHAISLMRIALTAFALWQCQTLACQPAFSLDKLTPALIEDVSHIRPADIDEQESRRLKSTAVGITPKPVTLFLSETSIKERRRFDLAYMRWFVSAASQNASAKNESQKMRCENFARDWWRKERPEAKFSAQWLKDACLNAMDIWLNTAYMQMLKESRAKWRADLGVASKANGQPVASAQFANPDMTRRIMKATTEMRTQSEKKSAAINALYHEHEMLWK